MVFLKNTAIRVGHSIIWSGRYSSRFAAVFHQVSFWLIKLVERAFFSKKFKYSSLIYSHIIINGFERLIFLTIFVYDGLLVGLLYAFYRLIAVSKFFRRFSCIKKGININKYAISKHELCFSLLNLYSDLFLSKFIGKWLK